MTFHSHHDIHPLPDLRVLFKKIGINQIKTANIPITVIKNCQLAVIANINAFDNGLKQPHRQRLVHMNPCLLKRSHPITAKKSMTAHAVSQQMNLHTARGSSDQRL